MTESSRAFRWPKGPGEAAGGESLVQRSPGGKQGWGLSGKGQGGEKAWHPGAAWPVHPPEAVSLV